jgi:hypothetical protein
VQGRGQEVFRQLLVFNVGGCSEICPMLGKVIGQFARVKARHAVVKEDVTARVL